jgi:general secretion pathway protein J
VNRACATDERGFTLLELIIAMTIMSLMSVALFGVVSLGATSAGSGERITEQARRHRIATGIITRQLRSTEPMKLMQDGDRLPFFLGESGQVQFVTAAPQKPDASGLALVHYWAEDGAVMMSEVPVYAVLAFEDEDGGLETSEAPQGPRTALMYDASVLAFEYLRDGEDEQWTDEWDSSLEDELPAVVRVSVESDVPDGPFWYHEIPLMVGAYNQLTGEEDFRSPPKPSRKRNNQADNVDDDDDDDDDDVDSGDDSDDDFDDDD